MSLQDALRRVDGYTKNPEDGLPEDVFLFVSRITPLVNVDLLVRDDAGRILLSWRDDPYEGRGWHVPGGIVRVKERFEDRIQKTALQELGCSVFYKKEPLEIVPIIKKDASVRCHFITFVYDCRIPEKEHIGISNAAGEAGYLKWHDSYPQDMLRVHSFYRKYFLDEIGSKLSS